VPLTAKGKEILSNMKEQYGSEEKAKEVLYASKNAGTITGIDKVQEIADAESNASVTLPATLSAAQINEQNRRFWFEQTPEGAGINPLMEPKGR
jgi:hypothetical protein